MMRMYCVVIVTVVAITQVLTENIPRLKLKSGSTFIQVFENETIGYFIDTLVAEDEDDGDKLEIITNSQETSSLVELSDVFGDNSKTGLFKNITLKNKLDRDYEPSIRSLNFKVTDSTSNTETLHVTLFIIDVNDEAPTFLGLPYIVKVFENETIGKEVFKINATDPDTGSGGLFTIYLKDALGIGNPFEMNEDRVILKEQLNYSVNTYYQLKVHAMDKAHPFNNATPVDLIVNVLDIQNSPPHFLNQPYTTSVLENAPKGQRVLGVYAVDGDKGVPNKIEYSLVGDAGNFTINKTTGEIFVDGELDADSEEAQQSGGLFTLIVNASEVITPGQVNLGETSTTAKVFITIEDVNDNIPMFLKSSYTASVAENSPKGIPLTMSDGELIEVYDADQVLHNIFVIYLDENNNMTNAFETIPSSKTQIRGRSTVILKVNDSSLLDYEERTNITFKIMARENETVSEADIVVQIEDVNDNSPVFDPTQQTSFTVKEHSSNGTFIGTIIATDMETEVRYSLDGDDEQAFAIDQFSGNLTVAGNLDREIRSSYSLFVIAKDSPGDVDQQRSTRKRITVDLLDINDNAPEFISLPSGLNIPEDTKVGTELVKIKATDKDNGTNQEIVYSLTGTPFLEIHPINGNISVNDSLIGMSGTWHISVMAKDKGVPPLNSTEIINLHISDVNLHRPEFFQPSPDSYNLSAGLIPKVRTEEEQISGSHVYHLFANDSDSGLNGEIYYSIVPDSTTDWQSFRVHRQNGELTNFDQLDRETKASYRIIVLAEDRGIPSLFTTVTLEVELIDINDNDPVFEFDSSTPYMLTVEEEQDNVVVGRILLAVDKDETPIVFYYILGGELTDHFSLNSTSGMLSLVKKLDRETRSEVDLIIHASSHNQSAEPNSVTSLDDPPFRNNNTLLWVRVVVQDINDQPPVFSDEKLTVGFLYDAEYGDVIKELREEVRDDDVGINSITYFRLTEPITTKDMSINSGSDSPITMDKNGTIRTNMLFSSDMTGAFILKVEAYDIGNLTSRAEIEIYIISDIQRLKIVFRKTPDEVRSIKNELIKALEDETEFRIIADKIATHQLSDGTPDVTKTDMFIHGRYLTDDKVVPAEVLWRTFDLSSTINLILEKYGVTEATPIVQVKEEDSTEDDLKKSLIIVTVSLAVIAVVLLLVLINLRSRYRRKLRAASTKTFGSAKDTIPDIIPPGTNKYYAAASNPVYMKEGLGIDLTDDSSSRNSLDENEVDDKKRPTFSQEPEIQEVAMTMYEEQSSNIVDGNHSSPLDHVLLQYQQSLRPPKGSVDTKDSEEPAGYFQDIDDLEQTDI